MPRGKTGARGAQGLPGPQGPAGPAITGGAQDDQNTVGPFSGNMTDLLEGAQTTGQLVLPFKGLITANGAADVVNSKAEAGRARCNLFISNGTGPNNGLTEFSPGMFGDTPAVDNYHVVVALAGHVVKAAGTYNIAVRCALVSGAPVPYAASFTYTAVPTA